MQPLKLQVRTFWLARDVQLVLSAGDPPEPGTAKILPAGGLSMILGRGDKHAARCLRRLQAAEAWCRRVEVARQVARVQARAAARDTLDAESTLAAVGPETAGTAQSLPAWSSFSMPPRRRKP